MPEKKNLKHNQRVFELQLCFPIMELDVSKKYKRCSEALIIIYDFCCELSAPSDPGEIYPQVPSGGIGVQVRNRERRDMRRSTNININGGKAEI